MDHSKDRLEENNIVNEIESSFLDYSMSVIMARALPDLRDGLSEPINVVVTPENQNYQAISSLYSFGVNSRITELQNEIALLENSKEAPHDLMPQSETTTSNSSHRPLVKRSDK